LSFVFKYSTVIFMYNLVYLTVALCLSVGKRETGLRDTARATLNKH